MSNRATTLPSDDRSAIYPVIDASRPVPLILSPIMTTDFRFLMTHLSPDEQRVQWLAEHGQTVEGEGEGEGEAGAADPADDEGEREGAGEEEDEEKKDGRPVYPLLADPSNPNCPFVANTTDGLPLATHLSPAEQHAEWLKEQERKRVGQDKAEQAAAAAGGAGQNGA